MRPALKATVGWVSIDLNTIQIFHTNWYKSNKGLHLCTGLTNSLVQDLKYIIYYLLVD